MSARKASEADIGHVMRHLSDISAGEVAITGYTIDEATAQMLKWAEEGEAVAITIDDFPIAILVFKSEDLNVLETSFMATQPFFNGSLPTRYLKRFLDDKMKKRPSVAVVSTTYSRHPSLHRWYRRMGYRDPATDGASFTFVREPR